MVEFDPEYKTKISGPETNTIVSVRISREKLSAAKLIYFT